MLHLLRSTMHYLLPVCVVFHQQIRTISSKCHIQYNESISESEYNTKYFGIIHTVADADVTNIMLLNIYI